MRENALVRLLAAYDRHHAHPDIYDALATDPDPDLDQ